MVVVVFVVVVEGRTGAPGHTLPRDRREKHRSGCNLREVRVVPYLDRLGIALHDGRML